MPVSPVDTKWLWRARRKFVRYELEMRFTLIRANGVKVGGWSRDISEGGLGGIAAAELTSGEQITVELSLPGRTEPVRISSSIRYSVGTSFGMEFTALSPQQRAAILECCSELQLAD